MIVEKKRFGCSKSGDCPGGARDSFNRCLHTRYCSRKIPIKSERDIRELRRRYKHLTYKL